VETSKNIVAHYANSVNRTATFPVAPPYRDIVGYEDSGNAWYDTVASGALITNSSDTAPQKISSGDSPFVSVPAWSNFATDSSNGTNQLLSLDLSMSFKTYICAAVNNGTDLPERTSASFVWANNYTELASALWQWDGSGTFSSDLTFAPSRSAGVDIVDGTWSQIATGASVNPRLPVANVVSSEGRWI
jgi:hypothetical protein